MQSNDDSKSFTFKVEDAKPKEKVDIETCTPKFIIHERVDHSKFDDFSHKKDRKTQILMSPSNGLMAAAHFAYVNHYPLKISVSDFILMISQGLAAHMEVHAEDVRPYFVNHEGKELITIFRPNFQLEGGNDWSTVFGEFAEGVKKRIKMDFYDIMVDDTSVATKLSRISSEIAIMDTFKHYFEYGILRGCAITEVTLVGSKEDWEKLRTKVTKLNEFNINNRLRLDWWLNRLVPLVNQIVDQAVSRKIDKTFWSKIYQSTNHKGGYRPTTSISGWLNIFNPYLIRKHHIHGRVCEKTTRSTFGKIEPKELMNGVSQAPVIMGDLVTGKMYPMTVYGGFLGAKINEDGTVGTEYFYAATFDDCPENRDIKGISIE